MNRHDRAFIADVFGLTEGEVPDFARPTCPSCANFKAKLDREKMVTYLLNRNLFPVGSTVTNGNRVAYGVSKALIAYLTE